MIRLVLVGAAGRMGRAVVEAAARSEDMRLKARVDRPGNDPGGDGVWHERIEDAVEAGDVVIDFSSPEALIRCARTCADRGAKLVSGTTGLADAERRALHDAAAKTAVLHTTNFSLGVLALRRAVAAALDGLPGSWDVEIVERHHRLKADSPSGTALTLLGDVKQARGTPDASIVHGREGRPGARPSGEIGVHAVRGGTWTGDHLVLLAGEGEWLELRHVAQDRAAFASGALAAARFVANASPGLYTLLDLAAL